MVYANGSFLFSDKSIALIPSIYRCIPVILILKTVEHILTIADSNRQEQQQPRSLFFCLLLSSVVWSRVFCDQLKWQKSAYWMYSQDSMMMLMMIVVRSCRVQFRSHWMECSGVSLLAPPDVVINHIQCWSSVFSLYRRCYESVIWIEYAFGAKLNQY